MDPNIFAIGGESFKIPTSDVRPTRGGRRNNPRKPVVNKIITLVNNPAGLWDLVLAVV